MRRPGFDFKAAARHPNRKTGTRASGVPAGTARPLSCHDPGTRRTGNLESGRLLRAGGLKVKGGSRVGIAAVSATSGRNTATLAPSCARMAGGQRSRGPAWVWPARAERWRKPAIVAVSVLGHVALFSYLGLRSMGLTLSGLVADPDPVIYVEITPRPLLPGEVARVRAVPEPPQVTKAPALPGPPTADPDRPFRNPDDEDSPAPPAPRIGAPAPGAPAPPPGVEGWAVRPETMGDRVGRGLRTRGPGCTSPGLLSRRRCPPSGRLRPTSPSTRGWHRQCRPPGRPGLQFRHRGGRGASGPLAAPGLDGEHPHLPSRGAAVGEAEATPTCHPGRRKAAIRDAGAQRLFLPEAASAAIRETGQDRRNRHPSPG
jgi:hypothetical protein